MFIAQLWSNPVHFIFWTVMVVFSVCCHELAHVYAALSQGDDTAARKGYLTLDPLKLMGPASLVALAFIGIAWGAVPVTPSRFRRGYSHAVVSAAGPGTNLLLAVIFALATAFIHSRGASMESASMFVRFFFAGLQVNCMLAILNILPIPMFDGWEVWPPTSSRPSTASLPKSASREAGSSFSSSSRPPCQATSGAPRKPWLASCSAPLCICCPRQV